MGAPPTVALKAGDRRTFTPFRAGAPDAAATSAGKRAAVLVTAASVLLASLMILSLVFLLVYGVRLSRGGDTWRYQAESLRASTALASLAGEEASAVVFGQLCSGASCPLAEPPPPGAAQAAAAATDAAFQDLKHAMEAGPDPVADRMDAALLSTLRAQHAALGDTVRPSCESGTLSPFACLQAYLAFSEAVSGARLWTAVLPVDYVTLLEPGSRVAVHDTGSLALWGTIQVLALPVARLSAAVSDQDAAFALHDTASPRQDAHLFNLDVLLPESASDLRAGRQAAATDEPDTVDLQEYVAGMSAFVDSVLVVQGDLLDVACREESEWNRTLLVYWVYVGIWIFLIVLGLGLMFAMVRAFIRRLHERDKVLMKDALQAAHTMFMRYHELRNPLHGIAGALELLEDEPFRPHVQELVDTIRSSSQAMMRLADGILDFERLQEGKMEIIPHPTDIRGVVRDVVNQFRTAVPPGVTLMSMVHHATPASMLLDGPRIRQVLSNGVTNAMKVTKSGKIVVRVMCVAASQSHLHRGPPVAPHGSPTRVHPVPSDNASVSPPSAPGTPVGGFNDGVLVLEVLDTGPGLAGFDPESLFMPFESHLGRKGHGLGLPICRQLVQNMGGNVVLRNALPADLTMLYSSSLPGANPDDDAKATPTPMFKAAALHSVHTEASDVPGGNSPLSGSPRGMGRWFFGRPVCAEDINAPERVVLDSSSVDEVRPAGIVASRSSQRSPVGPPVWLSSHHGSAPPSPKPATDAVSSMFTFEGVEDSTPPKPQHPVVKSLAKQPDALQGAGSEEVAAPAPPPAALPPAGSPSAPRPELSTSKKLAAKRKMGLKPLDTSKETLSRASLGPLPPSLQQNRGSPRGSRWLSAFKHSARRLASRVTSLRGHDSTHSLATTTGASFLCELPFVSLADSEPVPRGRGRWEVHIANITLRADRSPGLESPRASSPLASGRSPAKPAPFRRNLTSKGRSRKSSLSDANDIVTSADWPPMPSRRASQGGSSSLSRSPSNRPLPEVSSPLVPVARRPSNSSIPALDRAGVAMPLAAPPDPGADDARVDVATGAVEPPTQAVVEAVGPSAGSPSALPPKATRKRRKNSLGLGRKPRVLFVDDEEVNRRIGQMMLKKMGCEVTLLSDGDEIMPELDAAQEDGHPYEIAFVDIIMKRMHGDTAVAQLRATGCTTPIVCCTGNVDMDPQDGIDVGFTLVVKKPYKLGTLRDALMACLGSVEGRGGKENV